MHNLIPGSFYLRKKPARNTIFTNFFIRRLSACNFTKNELLHMYFSRILTANFRTPIFQNTFQVAASAEAYSGPCQTSKMELFVNIINGLKPLTIFTKKLHLRCFTRFCVCLCSEFTSYVYQTYKFKVYCNPF